MANPKPISEVRIGRVKAAIWPNGTDGRTRHNVTFSRLYKDGDEWKSTQSFSRNDLLLLAKVADQAPLAYLRASAGRRAAGGVLVRHASESGEASPRRYSDPFDNENGHSWYLSARFSSCCVL